MRASQSKTEDPLFVTKILVCILVGTPAAAFGAVHELTAGIYFALSALLLFYLFSRRTVHAPVLDLPTLSAIGLMGFTLFQIVPLPAGVVKRLAPCIYAVREGTFAPLHLPPPAWMPLSLDVSVTVIELGKLCLYLAIYWGVHHLVRRIGPRFVLRLVMIAGLIGAAILLTHKILMLDKIYGFYSPLFTTLNRDRISAPLINENHMAAFLGLCTTATVGFALGLSDRTKRLAAIGAASFIGGALILTLSRAGIAAFGAGQCIFIVLRLERRRKNDRDRAAAERTTWLPVGLTLAFALGLFAAQDAVIGEFLQGNVKKLDLFFEGWPLVGKCWTTGAGRGAFRVGFHMVSGLGPDITVTHAENVVVQLLADWGVLVGGAALILGVLIVGRFLRCPPERVEYTAMLSALIAFGIHNLVDFNMEIIGVTAVAAALLGTLQGNESLRSKSAAIPRISKVFVLAVAILAAASSAAALFYARPFGVDTEERTYRQNLHAIQTDQYTDQALKQVLERHPANAYIPFLVGVRMYQQDAGNPLPWFARAVSLYPRFANAHFYIGGTLLRVNRPSQAMLEFRLAVRDKPTLAAPVATLMVSRIQSFEALSKIAVTTQDKLNLWPALAHSLSVQGFVEEAEAADKAILRLNPRDPRSTVRQIRRLINNQDFKAARKMAEALSKDLTYGPTGILLIAESFEKTKSFDRAIAALERGLAQFGNQPTLLTSLAWARLRAGDFDGALKTAALYKSRAATSKERAQGAVLEARIHAADNRIQGALAKLREAHALDPENVQILKETYELAKRRNYEQHALEALRLLLRLQPSDPVLKAALSAYEKQFNLRGGSLKSDNL